MAHGDPFLENDVRPDDTRVLGEAAARLCERRLPYLYETQLVGLAVPALDIQEACLWVGRESILGHGLMLFQGLGDYRRWMRALVQGEPVRPRAPALSLELQHPTPCRYDPRLFVSPVRRRDVQLLGALCEALAAVPALLDVAGARADELRAVHPARVEERVVLIELRAGHPEATNTDRTLARVQSMGWRTRARTRGTSGSAAGDPIKKKMGWRTRAPSPSSSALRAAE